MAGYYWSEGGTVSRCLPPFPQRCPSRSCCRNPVPVHLFNRRHLNSPVGARHAWQGRDALPVRHLPQRLLDSVHNAAPPGHPQSQLPEAPVRLLPAELHVDRQPALAPAGRSRSGALRREFEGLTGPWRPWRRTDLSLRPAGALTLR